ncbi:MAG TPA: MFS transporter, partial [Actinomycetota bacterium]|nr:MFS transporter [Actinomycetota bacterium]
PEPASEQPPKPPSGGISLSGFGDVFRIRDFRRLFWGQAASALGDWVGTLAFISAAQRLQPHQPAAVAIVLILQLIPAFFATPIGGVLSDRWDRKKIMVSADIIRFGLILLVPFFPNIGVLYAIAFAQACFSLVFLPARDASVPNIVQDHHLEAANALVMASSYGGIPISGPIFALLAWTGTHFPLEFGSRHFFMGHPEAFAFFFDAVTFLVSAAFIQRMALGRSQFADENGAEGFFTSVKEGVTYIGNRPLLRGLAYSCAVAMLGGGVLFALGVGYVHQTLKGGDVEFGFLMGIFGAGMLGGFLISQFKPPGGVKWMVRIALLTMGSVLIVMGIFPVIWIAYGLASVFGASFSTAVIVAMSAVQGRSDDAHRGRVMAVVHMLFRIALSVGALAAAGIASAVPNGGLHLPILGFHPDKNQVAIMIAGVLIALGILTVRGKPGPEEEELEAKL